MAEVDAYHDALWREHPELFPPYDPAEALDIFANDLPCWFAMFRGRPKVADQTCDEPELAKLNRWMSRNMIQRLQELDPTLFRIGGWPLRIVAFLRIRRRNDHGAIPFGSADLHHHFGFRDSGNLNLGEEVEKLRAIGFTITLSAPSPGCSTDILKLEWPPAVLAAINDHSCPIMKRRDIFTGEVITKAQERTALLAIRDKAITRCDAATRQEEMKQYIRMLHEQHITIKPEQRLMADWYINSQWLLDRETEIRNQAIKAANTQIDNIYLLGGHQHYVIDKPRTPRVMPYGPNIGNLSRPLRWILLHDTIELDIRYCHLAAFAAITGAPLLKGWLNRLLHEHKSAWKELLKELNIPYSPTAKEGLKNIILKWINGMKSNRLFWVEGKFTREMAKAFNRGARKRFRRHPLINEIGIYRERIYLQMRESRTVTSPVTGYMGALAIFRDPDEPDKPPERVALSALMQEVETALLRGVRAQCVAEYAKPEPRFWVKLHQHDGFTIALRRTREQDKIVQELRQAVETDASALLGGVPTTLDCEAAEEKLNEWLEQRPPDLVGMSRKEHYEQWKHEREQPQRERRKQKN